MTISSAKATLDGNIFLVILDDGTVLNVPDNTANRHRQELQAWVDAGGVIAIADPAPTPPTKGQIIANEIAGNEALAGLIGEFAALKSITEAQAIADIKTRRGA